MQSLSVRQSPDCIAVPVLVDPVAVVVPVAVVPVTLVDPVAVAVVVPDVAVVDCEPDVDVDVTPPEPPPPVTVFEHAQKTAEPNTVPTRRKRIAKPSKQ